MEERLTLRPPEWVAVLELSIVIREAYSMGIHQFWYLSIDIQFILLHVEFEDRLFISVLKNRATWLKNLQLEIVKFQW
jgi:hypothetical protein